MGESQKNRILSKTSRRIYIYTYTYIHIYICIYTHTHTVGLQLHKVLTQADLANILLWVHT